MRITYKSIIGKIILVGLTYKNSNDEVLEQKQFYGKIINANKNNGITILINNTDEIFELPPDLSSINIASHGEYKLHSTGEIVINPDLLSTWIIQSPD